MIFKLLFKIGQQLRNPSLQSWLVFLKKTEKWSLEELEAYQLKKLQELASIAYEQSPYYRASFDAIGVQPSDIKTLEDVSKLPIISKEELITQNTKIYTSLKFNKVFKASTSGTSGESLEFKREEAADSFNRAAIFRGYSWYNVDSWERNGYFWGFNFSFSSRLKTTFLDFLQHRFRIFSFQPEEVDTFIGKLKEASYVHGYSSMIYETAKLINQKKGRKPLQLKMVKGTSEKIYAGYQEAVKKAFGVKMISEYGAAETGIIAFECPKGHMHVNMEGVLVEEINNEIIVTNLQLHSFPIIRYKLGDYIKLAPIAKKCTCGMQHPILEEVTGRIGELVYGTNHTYPSLYFYYIFKNIAANQGLFLNYQVIQNKKGKLFFLIEQALDADALAVLQNEIISYFSDDISFEIKDRQTLFTTDKKLKSFISIIA